MTAKQGLKYWNWYHDWLMIYGIGIGNISIVSEILNQPWTTVKHGLKYHNRYQD